MNGFGHVDHNKPQNYARLFASISARTNAQAAHQMLQDIELYISVYNLVCGLRRPIIRIGKRSPLNPIRLGPVQLIHGPNGRVTMDAIYCELDFLDGETNPHQITDSSDDNRKYVNRFFDLINRHPLQDILTSQAYGNTMNALGLRDAQQCLIRLWSCLEILTGSVRSEAKVTACRGAFLSKEYDYRAAKLTYIAQVRNSYVHAGTEIAMVDGLVADLKVYLAELLRKLVFNPRKFGSQEQFIQSLDLPHDPDSLRRRIEIAKIGLEMRRC